MNVTDPSIEEWEIYSTENIDIAWIKETVSPQQFWRNRYEFFFKSPNPLSILFAIITTFLVLIFGVVYGYRSINQVESEIGNSLSEAAYSMANNLDQYMWSRYGETSILSNLPDIRELKDAQAIETVLDQLQSTFPAFSWIGMTDKKGTVVAFTDSILKGADISGRPVYINALKKPFVGDVHEAVLIIVKV